MTYQKTVEAVYSEAAITPDAALCCTMTPAWQLPGLTIPQGMIDRNYGCGTTVHPRDLANAERVLYVGVGAGMEALQFSYFLRRPDGVVAIDTNNDMLDISRRLLNDAAEVNDWFEPSHVSLKKGDALDLPIENESVDVVAQNCLFNIFTREHLQQALAETFRVLKPHGRFVLSDPVSTRPIPAHLADDERLRAQCLSGALTLNQYLEALISAGFGTIEIHGRRPYRVLDKTRYNLDENLMLESVEVVAIKDPMPEDGACVFTGRVAMYVGPDTFFDDGKGHLISRDVPLGVCDKTAAALKALANEHLIVTEPTWHYTGGGCC